MRFRPGTAFRLWRSWASTRKLQRGAPDREVAGRGATGDRHPQPNAHARDQSTRTRDIDPTAAAGRHVPGPLRRPAVAIWQRGAWRLCGPHDPTIAIADVCALDVQSRIADDAVLFLWTTSPLLFACEPVIKAWGFTYNAHLIWDKVRGVCGSYVDVRHERLLIGTRGSCVPDRRTPAIHRVQTIQKSRVHSQKPDAFCAIIERLYDAPLTEVASRAIQPLARGASASSATIDSQIDQGRATPWTAGAGPDPRRRGRRARQPRRPRSVAQAAGRARTKDWRAAPRRAMVSTAWTGIRSWT